ncbi:MAG: fibrobacter succinogenes major paralogous domain-containing protein [bacterium]|nr:fibrobacter succinogenes major paralogous domain-containing protein [bacterium]
MRIGNYVLKQWQLIFIVLLFTGCYKGYKPIIYKESNTYKTIKISNQGWMAENLNVSVYRNGDSIPQVQDDKEWGDLKTGAWCYYRNDTMNGKIYGQLYNWYAVNDPRGLAPKGWHIPADSEWTILIDYLGGDSVAGGKMKETGTTHWKKTNVCASNKSEFSALPGGYRSNHSGGFIDVSHYGYWWSATDSNAAFAWYCFIKGDTINVTRSYDCKDCGFSVRCVRN